MLSTSHPLTGFRRREGGQPPRWRNIFENHLRLSTKLNGHLQYPAGHPMRNPPCWNPSSWILPGNSMPRMSCNLQPVLLINQARFMRSGNSKTGFSNWRAGRIYRHCVQKFLYPSLVSLHSTNGYAFFIITPAVIYSS